MKFFKAAAGAAVACILCAGMSITALAEKADEIGKKVISAGGESFEVNYGDASQDAGYLKYRHRLAADRMVSSTPSGMIKENFSTISGKFGSYLTHDSRFDGMDRTYLIDVSQWQAKINWEDVKADGINDVIIRLGYRGYGSAGTLMMDDRFYENINGAKAAGLNVGIYFYTQAISYAEAKQEADFCAAALKGYDLELPVYYDIESVDFDYGRLDHAGLTKAQKTKLCKTFCDRIESYGYQSGVYANLYWLTYMINGPELGQDYKTWVAAYMSELNYEGIYDMWQYSSSADIDGIKGGVDINVMYDVDYAPTTEIKAKIKDGVLSWNEASYADGYTIYGSDNGSESYFVADVETNSLDITKFTAGSYGVAAYNNYGGKRYYGETSKFIDSFRASPASVEAKRIGIDKVMLSWEAVSEAVGYEVYTSVDGELTFVGKTTDTNFELSGSQLELKKAFIRAYNKNGIFGAFTEPVALPGNAPAHAPYAELRANKLVWTAVSDADGYIVIKNDSGTKSEFTVYDTYCTIDEGLSADYTVQAFTELEGRKFRTSDSNICSFRGISYPPRGTIEVDSSADGLVWNKIDDALGYVVYEVDIYGTVFEVGRVDECSFNKDDLTGSVYFVKGYNTKDGKEFFTEPSNRVMISLPEVTEAEVVSRSDDYAVISWNSIEGCSEYMVYLDTGSGYELYSTVKGNMAMIGDLNDVDYASVRIKGYVGDRDIVTFGLFSNQLCLVGSEDQRTEDDSFNFDFDLENISGR